MAILSGPRVESEQKGLPMPGIYSLLYQAIEEKKQVIAMYDGYLREMCPHVLGSKDGVRHVLLFQFAGDSNEGLPPGGQWICMDPDGLSDVSLREGSWFTGPRKIGKAEPCVDIAHTSATSDY
jgi:hypothetical protein